MSFWQNNAFSISLWEPGIELSDGLEDYTFRYSSRGTINNLEAYSHVISRFPGYDTAKIAFKLSVDRLDWWLNNALNLHVEVYDSTLKAVWIGFVNTVSADYGPVTLFRGPLMDTINTSAVVYTRLFTDTTPPSTGGKWITTIATDADSRSKYGVLEEIFSAGTVTLTAAEQIRDVRLEENRQPPFREDINPGTNADTTVTLECLGYLHRFKKWIYEDSSFYTATISARISNVISDDPMGMYTEDSTRRVATNSILVGAREEEERPAFEVLQWLNSFGDVNNNIYRLGVFDDNSFFYQQVPNELGYYYRLRGRAGTVVDMAGNPIEPWLIAPAKWIAVGDTNIGQTNTADPKDDPRSSIIESVEFTAPDRYRLVRSKYSTMEQKLARLGLGGSI